MTIEFAGSPITRSLITRLTPMLQRMAHRSVRSEDVEDVVQETWLSALRSVSRYEGRSSIAVWIVGILKRRIADSYRRERQGQELREDAVAWEGMLAPECMQYAELVRLVEGALAELSELEREAVRLCDLQGMGRAEAAGALGITPGYLRVALHRARQRLAIALRRRESLAGRERAWRRRPGTREEVLGGDLRLRAALAREQARGGRALEATTLRRHTHVLHRSSGQTEPYPR